jgi:hypothetical protein
LKAKAPRANDRSASNCGRNLVAVGLKQVQLALATSIPDSLIPACMAVLEANTMAGGGLARGEFRMRTLAVGTIAALLMAPAGGAYAQDINMGSQDPSPMEEMLNRPAKEKAAEAEKEYQKALKSIKPQPTKNDPWGNVRAADPKQGSK